MAKSEDLPPAVYISGIIRVLKFDPIKHSSTPCSVPHMCNTSVECLESLRCVVLSDGKTRGNFSCFSNFASSVNPFRPGQYPPQFSSIEVSRLIADWLLIKMSLTATEFPLSVCLPTLKVVASSRDFAPSDSDRQSPFRKKGSTEYFLRCRSVMMCANLSERHHTDLSWC